MNNISKKNGDEELLRLCDEVEQVASDPNHVDTPALMAMSEAEHVATALLFVRAARESVALREERDTALMESAKHAISAAQQAEKNAALRADMARLRVVVEAATTFNNHFMHVSTGAAGTEKRRAWEKEAERLGAQLNAAICASCADLKTDPKP